jgi:hypothetical protein
MEIRAYRERPTLARPARRRAEQLWQILEARHAVGLEATSAHKLKLIPPRVKAT